MRQHPLLYIIPLLGITLSSACSKATRISSVSTSSIELSKNVPAVDSPAYYLVAPYKMKMEKIMNEVLGQSDTSLTKDLPQGTLGNFVADAVLKKTNDQYKPADNHPADVCLLNNGGLRAQLPKGNLTRGNIYELMPFENSVVILTLSGERTWQLFSSLVEFNGAPFSGAEVKAKGKKLLTLKINGKEFDKQQNYKVCTSDYLAAGGDKYDFFKDPIKVDSLDYKLRDAIIDHIVDESKKGKTISSKKDGRIIYE